MKTSFRAIFDCGNLHFDKPREVENYLSKFQGEPLAVSIEKYKSKRSLTSNRFYWKIIDLINKETGNDKLALHTFFKKKYLPIEMIDFETGESYMTYKSTAKLNTKEMTEYLDNVIQFTAEFFGIAIPDLNSVDY